MRKTAACVLLLAMLFTLCGCKKEGRYRVGICVKEDSAQSAAVWNEQLRRNGCETTVMPSPIDQAKQIVQVRELSEQGYDLLIIEPLIPSAYEDIIKPAQEAGIPVMIVNYLQPTPQIPENVCFIGYSVDSPGLLQASLLESLPDGGDLNGDGIVSYAVLTGPMEQENVDRQLTELRTALDSDGLLTVKYSDWSAEKGYSICTEMLAAYGKDIEVTLCTSAELTQSALRAVIDAGKNPGEDIYLIGMGMTQKLSEAIQDGSICGSVRENTDSYDKTVVKVALAMLTGAPYETQYVIGYETVKRK